jgi:SAM-dependent methyltransferase
MHLLNEVERYYSAKFADYGATARGVDWNGESSQQIRFRELLRLRDSAGLFSVNDYGCGYGALLGFLDGRGEQFSYRGFDLSPPMIEHARAAHEGRDAVTFVDRDDQLTAADYTFASGIFNVRLHADSEEWKRHILETLDRMDELSVRGFGFNMLTSYSDAERMRDDLFYGDPCFFFDHCKQNYARNVALLHDYGLWEFTILVRKHI